MGDHEDLVDDAGVVRIGSVVVAMIRPSEGHERAFNHWYERDHFYTAGLAAPGVFSAGRFVDPTSGWHLALYFVLPGYDDARVEFATEQMVLAAAEDRLFTERQHLHTWSYAVETISVGDDGVPLALALDHRYRSLHVAMFDIDIDADADADADADNVGVPRVAGPAMTLRPIARIMPAAWDDDVDPQRRRTVLHFANDERDQTDLADSAGVVWTGLFIPMVIGTDTYITG